MLNWPLKIDVSINKIGESAKNCNLEKPSGIILVSESC